MHTTTRTIEDAHPAGTNVQITTDGPQVWVQVCMVDLRHGYRVANTMWGGRIDQWVPVNDLHDDQEVPAMNASDDALAALRDKLNGRTEQPAPKRPLTTDEAIADLRVRLTTR